MFVDWLDSLFMIFWIRSKKTREFLSSAKKNQKLSMAASRATQHPRKAKKTIEMASPSSSGPSSRNPATLGSIQSMQDYLETLSTEFEQRYQDAQSHMNVLGQETEEEDPKSSRVQSTQNGEKEMGRVASQNSSKGIQSTLVSNEAQGDPKEVLVTSHSEKDEKKKRTMSIVKTMDQLSKGEIVQHSNSSLSFKSLLLLLCSSSPSSFFLGFPSIQFPRLGLANAFACSVYFLPFEFSTIFIL